MKALSLWQPWASLIAIGAKPFETRDWPPQMDAVGSTIAIHAGKNLVEGRELAELLFKGRYGFPILHALRESIVGVPDELLADFPGGRLPVACVVCTARLDAAFELGSSAHGGALVSSKRASRPIPPCFTVRTDDFGNYAPGRWAWLLRDVEPRRPARLIVGRQKLFEIPDDLGTVAAHG